VRELFTGKGKGFGFVEMPGKQQSRDAIAGLNGKEFAGRPLKVNEARPRPERGRRR
jgi:RNA recognition motif-containing protein